MIGAFQNRENLYLVMDLLQGGDLRYHIGLRRYFTEEQTSNIFIHWPKLFALFVIWIFLTGLEFFVCCILMGLDFLHRNGIIHRDIKPENIVFDEFGYLRITDFGIARYLKPENSQDTSGTPGYMGKSFFFTSFSTGGHVPTKPRVCRGLLRCWCDCIWMHVREGNFFSAENLSGRMSEDPAKKSETKYYQSKSK